MKSHQKSKIDKIRSAAIVKLKYHLSVGEFDKGFETVFEGVLGDLALTAGEVNGYIEKNRDELIKICIKGS